jgi:hypothetical protein
MLTSTLQCIIIKKNGNATLKLQLWRKGRKLPEIQWRHQVFTYAEVEAAFAKVHNVKPDGRKALKARINNFQKLGIVPSSPGKGKRITYELKDIYKWGLCLELAEFGIDPSLFKEILQQCWDKVSSFLLDKYVPDDNRYYVFVPSLMRFSDARPWFELGVMTGREAQEMRVFIMGWARLGAINLTTLRDNVEEALGVIKPVEGGEVFQTPHGAIVTTGGRHRTDINTGLAFRRAILDAKKRDAKKTAAAKRRK